MTQSPIKAEQVTRKKLRVGIVPYLNMMPLVRGMAELQLADGSGIEVLSVPPSQMMEMMDRGDIDLGMAPVGGVLTRPTWKIVGDSMIGSNGPVRSVLGFGTSAPETWKYLHPDSHSRSSNNLIRILLDHLYDVQPVISSPIPLRGWFPPTQTLPGESFLLIGTRALRWRDHAFGREHAQTTKIDLGELWTALTGLPFVFAVWALREGIDPEQYQIAEWMDAFEKLKHKNQSEMDQLIAELPDLGEERLPHEEAKTYLTQDIKFDLGDKELQGLEKYYEEGLRLNLFPKGWNPNQARS